MNRTLDTSRTNTTRTNTTRTTRRLTHIVALAAAATVALCGMVSLSPAEAAKRPLRPQGVALPITEPRYIVKATSFFAGDESNVDWLGSDEPYWIFSSHATDGRTSTTSSRTFDDVDSGESRDFAPSEGCLWSSACTSASAPRGIGFTVQLWEEEFGQAEAVKADTQEAFSNAGDVLALVGAPSWTKYLDDVVGFALTAIADDHVDTQSFFIPPSELAAKLPTKGSSYEVVRHFSGDDGYGYGPADYDLRIQVRRVA